MKQVLIITVLGLLSLSAWGKSQPLPRVQVTRYISPAGIEHLNLHCVPQPKEETFRCEVIHERNGRVLSTEKMSADEVKKSLSRYFRQVPRAEVYRVGKVPEEKWEQKSGTALVWSVSWGDYVTKGSAPYQRDTDSEGLLAILSLEMDLSLVGVMP